MRKLLTAILVTLVIPMGIAWSHPVYDERGHIVGETLEDHTGSVFETQGGEEGPTLRGVGLTPLGHLDLVYTDVDSGEYAALLRECLEYIRDSSVVYNDPSDRANFLTRSTLAIYELRSAQTDADEAAQAAQEQADRMRERAERYRRETELHHRIVEMIKKLEGGGK